MRHIWNISLGIRDRTYSADHDLITQHSLAGRAVLELGAGAAGIPGLAASMLGARAVLLTDTVSAWYLRLVFCFSIRTEADSKYCV